MNPTRSDWSTPVLPWTPRQVFWGTVTVLAVGMAAWALYASRIALFSLFTAVVISTAIAPAVDWLRRHGVPAAAGVLLIYLVFTALVVSVALLFVPLLTVQGATIVATFGSLYSNLIASLRQSPSIIVERLAYVLPATLALAPAPRVGTSGSLDALLRGLGYLGLVGDGLFTFVAVMLLAFYWTLDRDRVVRWLLLFTRIDHREQARELFLASERKIGGYIRGVALLSLIVGALAFGAYLVIGLPFALLLGVTGGLLEAVPIIGPSLGAVPALIVAASTDPGKIVWVLAANGTIQVLENWVLAPRVMRHTVGVNPVVTLLSLLAFGSLLGLPGALMAIPIAAVVQLLLDAFVLRPESVTPMAPAGRGSLSVLRYDAQELARDVRNQWRRQPEELPTKGATTVEETIEVLATDLDALLAGAAEEGDKP